MDFSKLIKEMKANGFKGFCAEFKAQYSSLSRKGKTIFWCVVGGLVLLVVGIAAGPQETEYKSGTASGGKSTDGSKGEVRENLEMLKEGADSFRRGAESFKQGVDNLVN